MHVYKVTLLGTAPKKGEEKHHIVYFDLSSDIEMAWINYVLN